MSAIGSVIVMGCCASFSPGGLRDAGELALVRHLSNADPAQAELAVNRLGPAALLASGIGADAELRLAGLLDPERCLGHLSSSVGPEREAEVTQQRPALVVGRGCGHERDVHATDPVDLVLVDLVEHHLLVETEGVV